MLGSNPLAVAGQGRTPDRVLDLDREQARAKLKANLFQIDTEPVRVGRYTILSRLGQGGMGVVYAAYDEDLDRKIAVKVVLPSSGSDTARSRMRREAQAMARLSHPNIVTVHEVGEVDDQVFIAMEFVRGQSLDQWIDGQERPWTEVLEVYRKAGLGLDAAHRAGLVHRDFKPHNVMLGDDGSVKVLDFGLARDEASFDRDTSTEDPPEQSKTLKGPLTRTGAIVGTPAYMSPEQHHGKATSARSDQFSFCVALYAGLHGHHPFEGKTLPALVHSVCEGRLRPPEGSSRVPAWLDRVVRRGLSSDPQGRFPSMEALLDALAEDPGARRRRRLTRVGTVALVFVGGFGVAQWAGLTPQTDACPDGKEQLANAWSDDRRAAIATAMGEHESSRAEATWTRVEPMLEDYAETWAQTHDDSCRAHRAGTRSDLLYERGRACLARSAEALRTVSEQLQAPDEAMLDKAVVAVAGLPALVHCQDANVLLTELTPPDPAIASEVAALRQRLSRAQALENLGRLPDSVTVADEVLQRADALAYPPLRAEALLQRGRARMWGGEGEAADTDLGDAAWLAMGNDHDLVAAEAAAKKIYARSELQGRPSEAAVELPWAEAIVADADDPELRGLFLNNAAAVRARGGKGEQAIGLLQRALEVRRSALPSTHPDIALSLANLGRLQNEQGLVDAAIPTLREAATSLERALGPQHPQRALVATMLATALLEAGRFAEAEAELNLARDIHAASVGSPAMPRFHVLAVRGELELRRRRWAAARAAFEQGLALAEPIVGPEHPMLADLHFGRAHALAARGERTQALALATRTAERVQATLGDAHPYVARGWLHLGELQLGADDAGSATQSFERARATNERVTPANPASVAWTDCWLGRAALARGDDAQASSRLRSGVDALADALPTGNRLRLEALLALARVQRHRGDFEGAIASLTTAEAWMASTRSSDDPALAWARLMLAQTRFDATTDTGERTELRNGAAASRAVLAADPGWASETATADAWLDPAAP